MTGKKLLLMKSCVVAAALCFQCCCGPSYGAEYSLVRPAAGAPAKAEAGEIFVAQTGVVAIPADAAALCAQMTAATPCCLISARPAQTRSPAYSVTVNSVTRDVSGWCR